MLINLVTRWKVEKRIGDFAFSISELCSLIRVLSLGARGDVQVTKNVWIHLGSRYKEVDASNIATVYCVMRYITPDVHYLWKVVEKQLKVMNARTISANSLLNFLRTQDCNVVVN